MSDKSVSSSNAKLLADTLENLVSNMGNNKDKNFYNTFVEGTDVSINRHLADTVYRFQWMSKVVDIPPYDMTREWRTWRSDDVKPEVIKQIQAEEKRLEYKPKIQEALTWGDLYGGCTILISVDGHGDASLPLDVTKIKKGQLKGFFVVDRWRIFPQIQRVILDPTEPFFGDAEHYMLMHNNQMIHRSRLVKFTGKKVPYWPSQRLLWWGDSVLTRVFDAFKNTESVFSGIAALVQETNVDVISVAGLADALSEDGDDKVKKRFELLSLMKAINNLVLLDSEETYTRNPANFQALPQLLQQFLVVLAAATDIPATRFLGKSPDGMDATGESDITNYYDRIKGQQESDLAPKMRYLDEVMLRSLTGDYPDSLEWEFNPLWQMSETDQATLRKTDSETLLNLQALGVPDKAILKDVQEKGLSNNLTEELVNKALAELEDIPEDEETEAILKGEEDDKSGSDEPVKATESPGDNEEK